MRVRVDYADMLGMPYMEGALEMRQGALDCYGATAEVVRRVLGDEAHLSFLALLHGEGQRWEKVEPFTLSGLRLGDVALSIPDDGGLHVSAVVSLAPALVLSSARKVGVYTVRLSAVSRIEGVYRYPG